MLALIESPGPEKSSREVLQALLDHLHRQTLGTLLTRYRKSGLIPDGYDGKLSDALALRNQLTHHYFPENIDKFGSAAGRDAMIRELNQHAATMLEIEQELASFTKRWHAKHGITDQAIKAMEQEIQSGGA
jgi:hypothetical protein